MLHDATVRLQTQGQKRVVSRLADAVLVQQELVWLKRQFTVSRPTFGERGDVWRIAREQTLGEWGFNSWGATQRVKLWAAQWRVDGVVLNGGVVPARFIEELSKRAKTADTPEVWDAHAGRDCDSTARDDEVPAQDGALGVATTACEGARSQEQDDSELSPFAALHLEDADERSPQQDALAERLSQNARNARAKLVEAPLDGKADSGPNSLVASRFDGVLAEHIRQNARQARALMSVFHPQLGCACHPSSEPQSLPASCMPCSPHFC